MGTSNYRQFSRIWIGGGARRDRTADLYNAIVALSQLSYGPGTMRREPNDCSLGCQGRCAVDRLSIKRCVCEYAHMIRRYDLIGGCGKEWVSHAGN